MATKLFADISGIEAQTEFNEKVKLMKSANSETLAQAMFDNLGNPMTAEEIADVSGLTIGIKNGIDRLRNLGFIVENLSGNNKKSKWVMVGVRERNSRYVKPDEKVTEDFKPVVHPLINQVFC